MGIGGLGRTACCRRRGRCEPLAWVEEFGAGVSSGVSCYGSPKPRHIACCLHDRLVGKGRALRSAEAVAAVLPRPSRPACTCPAAKPRLTLNSCTTAFPPTARYLCLESQANEKTGPPAGAICKDHVKVTAQRRSELQLRPASCWHAVLGLCHPTAMSACHLPVS